MVKVKVQQGWLEGEVLDLVTGDGTYYSFKGVPYAKPPVGTLRFKAPEPPLPWEGMRSATEHSPVCPQNDIFTNQFLAGNEDCLYLNVYTQDLKPSQPKAVMMFIHGGGYKSGSGNVDNYGPDFLVNHGIVLVTINYRLDALGFLCMETKEVPGNAGLKDQVQALKWIKENIAQFGGDPDNVTIFGESAGGASTALHTISPLSKGLFKRAIAMSGVPICDWSLAFEPKRRAFVLGKQLGCDTKDPAVLLKFLQSLPADKLCNTNPTVMSFEEANNNILKFYHFTPVIEKECGQSHFMTEDPMEALRNGNVNLVDVIFGYTSEEALVGIPAIESSFISDYNRYDELFVPRKFLYKATSQKVLEVSDRIRNYYFGDKQITLDTMREFVKYSSESIFTYHIHNFLKNFPSQNNKRYLYKFSCVSERSIYGALGAKYGITGAAHLDDLMYLFDAKKVNLPIDKNERSYKMVQQTCALFTNFAKFGNPTPDSSLGVIWQQHDNQTQSYMNIDETLKPGHHLDADAVAFWNSICEYADSDN